MSGARIVRQLMLGARPVRLSLITVVGMSLVVMVVLMFIVNNDLTGLHSKTPRLPRDFIFQSEHPTNTSSFLDLTSDLGRKSREQQVQRACQLGHDGDTMNILVHERSPSVRMSYCVVPKAGCTFWIRVFRFLNNDTAGIKVRTPWEIDRTLAHDVSRRTMKMFRLENPRDRDVIANSTRFMFSRDPYTRLWSAYVDKLLLPNHWLGVGRRIVSARPNASQHSLKCGDDVSFQEFVEFVVQEARSQGSRSLNGHWRPIQYLCDPCKFRPHFLGKQETFITDADTILGHVGLRHLLQGYDKKTHVRDEIAILVRYNFAFVTSFPPSCLSPEKIATLLLRTFQINGYISPQGENTNELNLPVNLDPDSITDFVYRQIENTQTYHGASALTRRKFLVQAYRQLPRHLLDELVNIYNMDFEYFGYERRPRDIFGP